jgi:hypothetical protein
VFLREQQVKSFKDASEFVGGNEHDIFGFTA